jgi:hypothetical protein
MNQLEISSKSLRNHLRCFSRKAAGLCGVCCPRRPRSTSGTGPESKSAELIPKRFQSDSRSILTVCLYAILFHENSMMPLSKNQYSVCLALWYAVVVLTFVLSCKWEEEEMGMNCGRDGIYSPTGLGAQGHNK